MSAAYQLSDSSGIAIRESKDTVFVTVETTGFKKENVTISVRQSALIVDMFSCHEPGDSYYLGELESEQIRRVIPLSDEVDWDSLEVRKGSGSVRVSLQKRAAIVAA